MTASALDTDSLSATRYQGFADVTSSVAAAGNGVYTVGNVQTGTGEGRYGGWGLVVVYRNPAESVRRLLVYDGLFALQSGLRTSADVSLTGFVTPPSGTVVGRLGILAWEGDKGITGDTATFAGRSLTDTLNPVANVFNSTISRAGAVTTGRTPSYVNQLGYDKDEFTIDGFLGNNVSSATVHLATATDTYLPGVMALAFDEGPPFASTPASVGGTARDGETLTADPGVWQGSTPITFTYQWRRCDANGANCVDIAGATGAVLCARHRGRGLDRPGRRDRDERGRVDDVDLDPDRPGRRHAARQHGVAVDLRHHARRRDAHRRPRHLDRDADHHLRVPVAPVRHGRRELRRHRRRDGVDVHADGGRRRHARPA